MGIFKLLKNVFSVEKSYPEPDAGLDDIPSIFNAISGKKDNGDFVVFMPSCPREGDEDVLNIQFSVEDGRVGLDWVLISPINIAEKQAFLNLCKKYSLEVQEKNLNGCSYHRVENGDLAALCKESILQIYPNLSGKCLGLVIEGFAWSNA